MPPTRCEVWAPAKLNLGLSVLRRREDGYHDLETIFVAVDLYDRLIFSRSAGGLRLGLRSGPDSPHNASDFPLGEENLIMRAARLVERETGIPLDLSIEVDKRIPSAAGLGGGSSDAAATLWAVNTLWDLRTPPEILHSWASRLGSDVPFFLNGYAAHGEGRGEVLVPLALYRDWWAVLIHPGHRVSTGEIYSGLSLTGVKSANRILPSGNEEGFFSALRRFHNDLEDVVVRRIPTLIHLRDALLGAGAEHAAVSGSGPTVFGIFRSRPDDRTLTMLGTAATGARLHLVQPVMTDTALKTVL